MIATIHVEITNPPDPREKLDGFEMINLVIKIANASLLYIGENGLVPEKIVESAGRGRVVDCEFGVVRVEIAVMRLHR